MLHRTTKFDSKENEPDLLQSAFPIPDSFSGLNPVSDASTEEDYTRVI